jgi:hypothetical protein
MAADLHDLLFSRTRAIIGLQKTCGDAASTIYGDYR